MIKKLLVVSSLFVAILQPVYAADSSPSADIKSKLEELKKEIASKAAKLKQEVNKKLKNKAYIGFIKQKSDQSITISSNKGPKIISYNQDTALPKKLTQESYIAALGDIDEAEVLIARKIVLLKPTNPEPKTYLWGQIISISDNLATLKDRNSKNVSVSGLKNVKLNDFVILTGRQNKNNIFQAEFTYVTSKKPAVKEASPSGLKAN